MANEKIGSKVEVNYDALLRLVGFAAQAAGYLEGLDKFGAKTIALGLQESCSAVRLSLNLYPAAGAR